MIKPLSLFKKTDWTLIIAALLLVAFGLTAIYSVALGRGTGEFLNFQKQLVWLVVGLVFLLFFSGVDYHHFKRWSWIGYFVSVILLILVLTPLGSTIRGTRGWFDLGLFSFQPVELVKIFLILVLANIYSQHGRSMNRLRHVLAIGLAVLIPLILVMVQPDFGSAMVLFLIWFVSFVLVTKNKWHIVIIIILLASLFLAGWFFVMADFQKDRIKTFLDPSLDPLDSGYNVSQSLIAVGAGRMVGRGLGFGSQSQLKFIPESQTDFVFAVLAEELGFVGVLFVLGFLGVVFYRLYKIARRAPDDFGMFLVILVLILIFIHVVINIGMGIGLLPVTGISLPFVSYGGSFLVATLFLLGMTLSVYRSGLISRR